MKGPNPTNERLKYLYFKFLKEAKGHNAGTVDRVAASLNRFEEDTRFRDFKTFRQEQAIAFKRRLGARVGERSGEPLSKATLYGTLTDLKRFFQWLAGQPGFRSKFTYADAEYFNLSDTEVRIAKAHRERPVPTVEQIAHVVRTMTATTEIERRDRALIAWTVLTGMRDDAIASVRLKHVDIEAGSVFQDARDVRTKARKTIYTALFPVDPALKAVVVDWIEYLVKTKLWSGDDPVFPATRVSLDHDRKFKPDGLKREGWRNAGPIRRIFKEAFEAAGLPYFNPHSFRKTLALLGQQVCRTPEEMKAWSQNLGHEQVLTTLTSYGAVATQRQIEVMRQLGAPRTVDPAALEMFKKFAAQL